MNASRRRRAWSAVNEGSIEKSPVTPTRPGTCTMIMVIEMHLRCKAGIMRDNVGIMPAEKLLRAT